MKVRVGFNVSLTDEDIDDIMEYALDGGVLHWCCDAKVVGKYLGDYASQQISRGGSLILTDVEDWKHYELTREKFLNGVVKTLQNSPSCLETMCSHDDEHDAYVLNTHRIDGIFADEVVQYALFGELVFG